MENKLNCITSTGEHQFDKESNRIECKICGLLKSTIEANSTKDVELETKPLVIKNGFADGGNVKVKDVELERIKNIIYSKLEEVVKHPHHIDVIFEDLQKLISQAKEEERKRVKEIIMETRREAKGSSKELKVGYIGGYSDAKIDILQELN